MWECFLAEATGSESHTEAGRCAQIQLCLLNNKLRRLFVRMFADSTETTWEKVIYTTLSIVERLWIPKK